MALEDAAARAIENLAERPDGPLAFRLAVQPAMAALMAVRDGLRDARGGRPPFGLQLAGSAEDRRQAWREAFRAPARVVIFALLLDVAYQLWFLRALYPGEALLIAIAIGFLPYLLVRGPVARIARHWVGKTGDAPK
ncbi:hypothetical protein CLV78_11919 [Aliiruegeria haliotis]|uniref:Uncharacterized protein n=1 Tax=Aliiruegeria haliotis TaxID=1280846 RepID=A0A2T0REV5_9RHOB|nr:hypothetical protein [Aliiruegeria haliotis]PRY19687.1 hypothetical protein CLV78_11919 [Aliiruegeria haliotis]